MDWFNMGKGGHQDSTLSQCFFNLHVQYNGKCRAGTKIAGRNVNNLRYADDTTLKAESEEELRSLLMRVESEKAGLKFNTQKKKSWHQVPRLIEGRKSRSSDRFYVLLWMVT